MSCDAICEEVIKIQVASELAEASMKTLDFYVQNVKEPTSVHLQVALRTCTSTLWKVTSSSEMTAYNTEAELEILTRITKLFQSVLPSLIDWSVTLSEVENYEAFCKVRLDRVKHASNNYPLTLDRALHLSALRNTQPVLHLWG